MWEIHLTDIYAWVLTSNRSCTLISVSVWKTETEMGTYTTNYNLFMPTVGETGWGTLVNGNFATIDTTMKSLSNRITAVENEVNGALSCTSVTASGDISGNNISGNNFTVNGTLLNYLPVCRMYAYDGNISFGMPYVLKSTTQNGLKLLSFHSGSSGTVTFKYRFGWLYEYGAFFNGAFEYQDSTQMKLNVNGYASFTIKTASGNTYNISNDGEINVTSAQLQDICSGISTVTMTSSRIYTTGYIQLIGGSTSRNMYLVYT